MAPGSEHSVLGEGRLQELRAGGNSGQSVATATASAHTEEEIVEMRQRAAQAVANAAGSLVEKFGHGGEVYGAYVAPKKPQEKPQGQLPGPL